MKDTKLIMGMPIVIEIDAEKPEALSSVFDYFRFIDRKFSTYKKDSEVSLFNKGKINKANLSPMFKKILELCEQTKLETDGYFDIQNGPEIDPSGLVKGWAIFEASKLLDNLGIDNYYIDAGGDIQVKGLNQEGSRWRVGIRNPFKDQEIIKAVGLTDQGIATSGTYLRGQHIYNPKTKNSVDDIISITVIGPNIYEADRFATAAFAMGKGGIYFLEAKQDLEAMIIDSLGIATFTTGFNKFLI